MKKSLTYQDEKKSNRKSILKYIKVQHLQDVL